MKLNTLGLSILMATVIIGAMAVAYVIETRLAWPTGGVEFVTTTLTGTVNDFGNMLTIEQEAKLDAAVAAIRLDTGDVLVVVTLESLPPGLTIRDHSLRVFNENGIGQVGKNNGVLILLSVREQQVRITVGLGLEDVITNEFAGETVRNMVVYLRQGNVEAGLLSAIDTLGARLREAAYRSNGHPVAGPR